MGLWALLPFLTSKSFQIYMKGVKHLRVCASSERLRNPSVHFQEQEERGSHSCPEGGASRWGQGDCGGYMIAMETVLPPHVHAHTHRHQRMKTALLFFFFSAWNISAGNGTSID